MTRALVLAIFVAIIVTGCGETKTTTVTAPSTETSQPSENNSTQPSTSAQNSSVPTRPAESTPTAGQAGAPSPAPTIVASGHASGEYAITQAEGTAAEPAQITLRITATPTQSANVSWDLVCREQGGGVGNKSGQSTHRLPTTMLLPLPAPSESCIVSANAQLSGSGIVKISILDYGS
jgi:hypothetical protein